MSTMKIKKGDTVKVIAGKDKGQRRKSCCRRSEERQGNVEKEST